VTLISSGTLKGRCPVCGAADCACGEANVTDASGGGALRKYPLGRGRWIQLTDEAARARGLLPKKREPVPNKKRVSAPNKALSLKPASGGRG
jgi:hypothetical protein